ADRKHTSSVMKESDLAAAGMVASAKPGAVAKLLEVQALILTEIKVKVEKHKGKGRTVDFLSLGGGGWSRGGYGHGTVDSSEVDKESRHITVQTDFKLVDAGTEENLATHSPRPYRQTDKMKVSPFFGSAKTEADMTPRDEIIGEAVELGARQFLSKLVPCPVTYLVEVESSSQENCVEGVKLLRAEMYEEAVSQFKMALAEEPSDHHAAYAAGLACEATGRYDEALTYYKQACYGKNEPEYIDARKRLSENIEHIRTEETS
ncbi:MAG: tetratricopeptide repeat protein, partial [Planctomycetota bacterium]